MKIFSSEEIKKADQYTIGHEPITSLDLMERAGEKLVEKLNQVFPASSSYVIFAGPGNNGGDGLVMARLLYTQGHRVKVYLLKNKEYSDELKENIKKGKDAGLEMHEIAQETEVKEISAGPNDILIDALYGIGLSRPLDGLAAMLISQINQMPSFKVAIDVPSGLSADVQHVSNGSNTFVADLTLTIQLPKLAFMFAENVPFIGKWEMVDIHLSAEFIQKSETACYYLDPQMIRDLIRPRPSFGHKGTFGHVLIGAGSKGKIGAAILCAEAAARTGCGLLSVQVPASAAMEVHTKFPETMVIADEDENHLSVSIKNIPNYNAIGFGPGVDKHADTANVLKQLIQNASQPLVIDADGLNILAENKTWLAFVNGSTILTPHPGEFDRLTQKHTTTFERYKSQIEFSKKFGVYIVLKGHHTTITTPGGLVFFNSTGNDGMATGGSGDVLTGIITSLCAQGYSALHASLIGVYLHGYAGDRAAEIRSKTSLIASDIIEHIPDFFLAFEK